MAVNWNTCALIGTKTLLTPEFILFTSQHAILTCHMMSHICGKSHQKGNLREGLISKKTIKENPHMSDILPWQLGVLILQKMACEIPI